MSVTTLQTQAIELVRRFYHAISSRNEHELQLILSPDVVYNLSSQEAAVGRPEVLSRIRGVEGTHKVPISLGASQSGKQVASKYLVQSDAGAWGRSRRFDKSWQTTGAAYFEIKAGLIAAVVEYPSWGGARSEERPGQFPSIAPSRRQSI